MIETHQGDLLAVQEGIIVHGCNCQGVMGSGVAALVRRKWPAVYEAYAREHRARGLRLGTTVSVGATSHDSGNGPVRSLLQATSAQLPERIIVVNAMTQFDYGRDPRRVYVDYDAISRCFEQVAVLAQATGLPVHFPLIGCGLANGKWDEVSARIEQALGTHSRALLWMLPGT